MAVTPHPAASGLEAHGEALAQRVESFAASRILCIGDIMLDRFIYGAVDRISPEAPIPVFTKEREELMLGGAGNVVRNVLSLGASCCFVSAIGNDRVGKQLVGLMGAEQRVEPYLLTEAGRLSTKKTRYIAGNQQLLRSDEETREPIKPVTEQQMLQLALDSLPQNDLVIVSDYGKGAVTPSLVKALVKAANDLGKRVIIDPKQRDFSTYQGAYLVSPNLRELSNAAGQEIHTDEQLISASQSLMRTHQIQNILVTRSKDGMTLISAEGACVNIPAMAREVFDVSGAGDTAIATLGVALAAGLSIADAAFVSNVAAGIVVGRLGTATVFRTDLKTALYTHGMRSSQSKIMPASLAADEVANWKREKKVIGFTNGCFDIVHAGHVSLLQDAKAQCDKLIVAINSDDSVRRLKGEERPINKEIDRAMLIASLSAADLVVIFREDTPLDLIEQLRPDVLMKGADYNKDAVVGADRVEAYGGRVVLLPLKSGYSTTNIISKISS